MIGAIVYVVVCVNIASLFTLLFALGFVLTNVYSIISFGKSQ